MACTCCGLEGVEGTCSMCYGDPDHNTDGEYRRMLEEDQRRQDEDRQEREHWEREAEAERHAQAQDDD